jgi:hypothetical protein
LSKTDLEMKKVKAELTDSANLLLLHKGLTKHLQQLRIERHPVISKTKNLFKLQKKYENYINSIDAIRDTAGKLKVQSVKINEGIGKWKHQQKISNELLQEFLQAEDSDANYSFDDDDCQETSSSAPEDEHFDDYDSFCELWTPITQIPNPDHQCRYVHRERKRPIRLHPPTCPIQAPKRKSDVCHKVPKKHDIPMETPIVNENGILAKKLNEFQNDLQNHHNRKQNIDQRIVYLCRDVKSLIRQDAHYDTIGDVEVELNSLITEGAWIEKEIVRITRRIDDLRKRQGFIKIARAFMATVIIPEDPFQITTSVIQTIPSDDLLAAPNVLHSTRTEHPFDIKTDFPFQHAYYDNSELQDDNKKLQTATAQLQEELEKVKTELTQLYINLNNAERTPKATTPATTDFARNNTVSSNEIQDLLSLDIRPSKPVDIFDRLDHASDAAQQAKLAKELIKLANSYKVPELTFDVQASKRRFNFSTWYSKLQTILSMFPQTGTKLYFYCSAPR